MTNASIVWVLPDSSPPLSRVIPAAAERDDEMDVMLWLPDAESESSYGRSVTLSGRGDELELTVKAISPRLALDLARHPAEVVVTLEVDLTTLFALLTKVVRPGRRVVSLIEGDPRGLGITGSARWKVAFRRIVARFVDGFIANSPQATAYLTSALGVPRSRISEGWWLAGLPADLESVPPSPAVLQRGSGPVFTSVGRLTALKGQDRLLDAAAAYTDRIGPCRVWLVGQGEERDALEDRARRLGLADSVSFFGHLDHAHLKGVLEHSDAFVFPTLVDLVGRALVEALSVGIPAVVSSRSGAIGVLVHDGVNAVVVDPEDPDGLLEGLIRVTDPVTGPVIREGARATMDRVSVSAAARAVRSGITSASR